MEEKKNELMIVFGKAGWVYFKTNATTAREALDEFVARIFDVVDTSNLEIEDFVTEATLRNEEYEDLDSVDFGRKERRN